jgi:hypothetical protein
VLRWGADHNYICTLLCLEGVKVERYVDSGPVVSILKIQSRF